MRAVDCHVHLDFPQFEADRQDLIDQLEEEQIAVINISTDLSSIEATEQLSRENRLVWGAIGLHPTEVTASTLIELPALFGQWRSILERNQKIVAIGEIGLDYYRSADRQAASSQRAALEELIVFAKEVKKPIIFHCRQAYGDLATHISAHPGLTGVVHCFSGSWEEAKRFLAAGLYLSLAGNLTYPTSQSIVEVASRAPLERLLIETDCPFLPPQSHRGQRSDPRMVIETGQFLAERRGLSLTTLLQATTANAVDLFGLPNQ